MTVQRRHLAILVALCALVFWNSLSGAFAWDDETQLVKNPAIRSLEKIPAAFTAPFWGFANGAKENTTNFYRPVQTIIYTLGYSLGGLSPAPYHVISLALHAAASVFVYLICVQLLLPPKYALFAGALFAVHPVHTEAVAWIAGVADVACGAFYFASLWAYFKSGPDLFLRSRLGIRWLWISAALYLGALFSKEMALTLPLFVFLLSFRPGAPRKSLFDRLKNVGPFAAATLVYLALRTSALGFLANDHLTARASFLDWISLGIWVFGEYVWYTLIPYPLSAFRLAPLHLDDRMISTFVALLLGAQLLAVLFWQRKRFPEVWFWLAGFAVLLIPVFYFKGIGVTLLAERYLYIPSFAAVLLAATMLARKASLAALRVSWVVIVLFGGLTVARNPVWNGSERLYTETLKTTPEAAHFLINLSDIVLKKGDDAGARRHLEQALRSLQGGKYAYSNSDQYRVQIGLGALDARQRKFASARSHFELALEINRNEEWAYLYLGGLTLEEQSDYPLAIAFFKEAIRLGPLNEVARDYLGVALFNQGKLKEAAAAFREALAINPTYKDAIAHLEMTTRAMAQ